MGPMDEKKITCTKGGGKWRVPEADAGGHEEEQEREEVDRGGGRRPSGEGGLPRGSDAAEAGISPHGPGLAQRADILGTHGPEEDADSGSVCVRFAGPWDPDVSISSIEPNRLMKMPQAFFK